MWFSFQCSSVPHHRRDEYPTPGESCAGVVSSCECRRAKFGFGDVRESEGDGETLPSSCIQRGCLD